MKAFEVVKIILKWKIDRTIVDLTLNFYNGKLTSFAFVKVRVSTRLQKSQLNSHLKCVLTAETDNSRTINFHQLIVSNNWNPFCGYFDHFKNTSFGKTGIKQWSPYGHKKAIGKHIFCFLWKIDDSTQLWQKQLIFMELITCKPSATSYSQSRRRVPCK